MGGQGGHRDQGDRLSVFPPDITIEDYARPDIMDMMIWRYVYEQKDELIIRAWKHGVSKAEIGRVTGLGRTTAWRIIEKYQARERGECGHTPGGKGWPVCSLLKGHEVPHESADFWWRDEDTEVHVKMIGK